MKAMKVMPVTGSLYQRPISVRECPMKWMERFLVAYVPTRSGYIAGQEKVCNQHGRPKAPHNGLASYEKRNFTGIWCVCLFIHVCQERQQKMHSLPETPSKFTSAAASGATSR